MNKLSKTLVLFIASIIFVATTIKLQIYPINKLRSTKNNSSFSIPETSCGPVSLFVVNHLYGSKKPIEHFYKLSGVGDDGTCTFNDLLRSLQQDGVAAEAIKMENPGSIDINCPIIIRLDGFHFVVALPRDKEALILIDPPGEPKITSWEGLQGRWDGEAIITSKSHDELRSHLSSLGLK
jgi:ABC-type bacteriocin/lantibiotic exporter with double-glycine peptidase domain